MDEETQGEVWTTQTTNGPSYLCLCSSHYNRHMPKPGCHVWIVLDTVVYRCGHIDYHIWIVLFICADVVTWSVIFGLYCYVQMWSHWLLYLDCTVMCRCVHIDCYIWIVLLCTDVVTLTVISGLYCYVQMWSY